MQPDQAAGSELSTGSYSPVSAIESIVPDHDGANRYTCTEHNCNRSFGASARLRSHIKYDHEGLPNHTDVVCPVAVPTVLCTWLTLHATQKRSTQSENNIHATFVG
eukprot:174963_1